MRVATWNVNSLKARLPKVAWWLERAEPDVLLIQETKLADGDAPREELSRLGYELVHHGQGGWNGVAIASRHPATDVITNFGLSFAPPTTPDAPDAPDDQPLREARMVSAVCQGIRFVSIYAPNGRSVGSVFYEAKLAWFRRLQRWLRDTRRASEPLVVGGDFNVAPEDIDVWDPRACHGGTHVSPPERQAWAELLRWGLTDGYRRLHPEPDRYSWWDYRAGAFHKNFGMRIDHLLVTSPLGERIVWAEIDREVLDAGWGGASERIAKRRAPPSSG